MRCEGVDSMAARLRVARPRIPAAMRIEDGILISVREVCVGGEKHRFMSDDRARISRSIPDRD